MEQPTKVAFLSQVRAIDNYIFPWMLVCLNALLAAILFEVGDYDMSEDLLEHWDTVC